jgi:thioredoxin 1
MEEYLLMYRLFLGLVLCSIGFSVFAETPMVDNLHDAMALSEDADMPVLLIFGAEWCVNCKILKTDINNGTLSKEVNRMIICYINIDDDKNLSKEYRVKNIPDSRILVDKKEIKRIIGYKKDKYKEWLQND